MNWTESPCMNSIQQECIPVGYILSAGVAISGGSAQGGLLNGVSTRGVSAWGCLPREVSTPVHAGIHTPPVNRMTDACENITFLQLLLWTVMIHLFIHLIIDMV